MIRAPSGTRASEIGSTPFDSASDDSPTLATSSSSADGIFAAAGRAFAFPFVPCPPTSMTYRPTAITRTAATDAPIVIRCRRCAARFRWRTRAIVVASSTGSIAGIGNSTGANGAETTGVGAGRNAGARLSAGAGR